MDAGGECKWGSHSRVVAFASALPSLSRIRSEYLVSCPRHVLATLGWLIPIILLSSFSTAAADDASPRWYFLATGKNARPELAKFAPGFNRTAWTQVTFPHSFDKVQPQDNVFGWYLCVLGVPAGLKDYDLVLDLHTYGDTHIRGHTYGDTIFIS